MKHSTALHLYLQILLLYNVVQCLSVVILFIIYIFVNVFNVLVLLFCLLLICIKYNNSLFFNVFNVLVLLFCLLLIYVLNITIPYIVQCVQCRRLVILFIIDMY